jgi:hypothetical protein
MRRRAVTAANLLQQHLAKEPLRAPMGAPRRMLDQRQKLFLRQRSGDAMRFAGEMDIEQRLYV